MHLRPISSLFTMKRVLSYFVWAALFSLIFLSPLALASNRPTPLYVVQMLIFSGAFVWLLRAIFCEQAITWGKTSVNLWAIIFLGVGVVQIFLPSGFPPLVGKTAYVHATLGSLMKFGSYLVLFWLVLSFIRNEKQVSVLVRAMLVLAFGASLVGVIQALSRANKVLWFYEIVQKQETYTAFFSTFINPNHFASFIGMIVLVVLGRLLYLNAKRPSHSHHRSKYPAEKIFTIFVLAVSSTALFMSLSRGGIVFFILSLFIFYNVILWEKKRRKSAAFMILFIISTILMLLWIGLQPILAELETLFKANEDISLALRLLAWKQSWFQLFLAHPVFGTGLGTFQYVFPTVKIQGLEGFWLHGHSDWLEVFTESGVVGGIVFFMLAMSFLLQVWKVRSNAWDPYIKYNGSAALAAVLYILLMSAYDFPLRTTACAVYFSIIAGFAMKLRQFHDEMEGKSRVRTISLNSPWKRGIAGALIGLLFLGLTAQISFPFMALMTVRRGGLSSIPHLERAIRLDPLNAEYHYRLGLAVGNNSFFEKGRYNEEKMRLAIGEIEKAIALNPSRAVFHYGLARLYQKMRKPEEAKREYEQTVKEDSENPYFQIFYAIFCFNRAILEHAVFEKKITSTEMFKEGLKAYYKAREIDPAMNLTRFRGYMAGYDFLKEVFEKEGLLVPDRQF